MPNHKDIAPELITAYQKTHYKVFSGHQTIVLQIGKQNPELIELFKTFECVRAAFITPQNPFSEQCTEAENEQRLTQFKNRLTELNFLFLQGIGQDPEGIWPGEHSFLILNVGRTEASELSEEYGQNAYVFCEKNAVPELVVRPYPELSRGE